MIDRKIKSEVDAAREKIFERIEEGNDWNGRGEVVSEPLHEVTSFQDTRSVHEQSTEAQYGPVLNFQIFEKEITKPEIVIDRNSKNNFILIFLNWSDRGEDLEKTFDEVLTRKVNQMGSNSQKQTVSIHSFALDQQDSRKKMLILDTIDEHTSGVFIFDFRTIGKGLENKQLRLKEIGDFELDLDFKISEIRAKITKVKRGGKIMLGLFSECVQMNIVDNEFLLPEFFQDRNNCFSSLILPTSYNPAKWGMYFELAGIIQAIINLLSTKQNYLDGFYDAQREIHLRCINKFSHAGYIEDRVLASACSIYFGFEDQKTTMKYDAEIIDSSIMLPNTGIENIDQKIAEVVKEKRSFSKKPCQGLETEIQNGIYEALKGINTLSESFEEYRMLLFSIVIATADIWKDSQRKELKKEEKVHQMWRKFSNADKKNLIGKQTYGVKTTEGAILTAFRKSIQFIEEGRSQGSSLIYQLIDKENPSGKDAALVLDELRDKMSARNLNTSASVKTTVRSTNLLLDPNIMKYMQALYDDCKIITHMPAILKQAPVAGEYEFLFLSSSEKNVIERIHLKKVLTSLKDAVRVRYPEGISYNEGTPAFRELNLEWYGR